MMQFGPVPLAMALGGVLAHSVPLPDGRLRKGVRLGPKELERLALAGVAEISVARLGPDDVDEDVAAARLAEALVPDPQGQALTRSLAFTGRVNLNAVGPGVAEIDAAAVHALNRVHPAITLATLAPLTRVVAGTLTGTVKIISYAVPKAALEEACHLARGAIRVQRVVRRSASLILTEVQGMDAKLAAKGRKAVEGRVSALGMRLVEVVEVPHTVEAVAAALCRAKGDILLVLTGSATSDLYDTAPEGVRAAGGEVIRFGMPVDPGNLLFLGQLAARPVIGLPGCARSPALNGADWVLERLACGLPVGDDEIAAMGVGGLLKEITIRPQVREPHTKDLS
jgi:molybdenum cofactor cytidylyltransferase